jgi:hypothetical protein
MMKFQSYQVTLIAIELGGIRVGVGYHQVSQYLSAYRNGPSQAQHLFTVARLASLSASFFFIHLR